MKFERDERRFDFHDIGLAIKKSREASGMTQEQLAYIVDRAPHTIMYNENDGQHPSLNTFYQMVTMFDISVDQLRSLCSLSFSLCFSSSMLMSRSTLAFAASNSRISSRERRYST